MKVKVTQEELNAMAERHDHWLKEDCDGWEDMRADFREMDMRGLSFKNMNLSEAVFFGTDLNGAKLDRADMSGSYMSGATLCNASFTHANMKGVFLRGANLSGAVISYTDLSHACLRNADLSRAVLNFTNMEYSDLSRAELFRTKLNNVNLRRAVMAEANLYKAQLHDANLDDCFIHMACPDSGSFIGWKKASGKIVCLEIPADAKRSSATGRKCRCDKAKVLSITDLDGSPCGLTSVVSSWDEDFVYTVGETVSVKDFCEDRWEECAPGIHFFINREEAAQYWD